MILTVAAYQHSIRFGAGFLVIGRRPRLLTHDFLARERFPAINMPAIRYEHVVANHIPEWTLPTSLMQVTKGHVAAKLLNPMPAQLPVRSPVLVDIASVPLDQVTYEHWKSSIEGFVFLVTKQYGHNLRGKDIGLISVYKKPIKNFFAQNMMGYQPSLALMQRTNHRPSLI